MAGETTVGSIVGFLRLDATDWNRTLSEAGAAARALGQSDPNINVQANADQAMGRLAAVQGEIDALGQSEPNVDVIIDVNAHVSTAEERLAEVRALAAEVGATRIQMHVDADTDPAERALGRAQKSAFGLVAAAATLGPALIPVSGAVAGLGVAFGGLGAAGVLAILGIRDSIKAGTDAGKKFQGGLDKLQGNLNTLEATAATGVMKPFLDVVDNLQPKMPGINSSISSLAGTLGRVMVPAADGVETAFLKLTPLMTDLAEYAVKGANAFDAWAHGDGLQKFGGYAMAVLPGVLDDLGSLLQLAGKIAGAFSGWGVGVLGIIGTLADLLNSLPTDVLTTLASGGLAVYSAFKTFGLLSSMVRGLGGAIDGLGASMGRLGAAGAASRLQGVAGGLRAVGTAGSIAYIAVGGVAAVLGVAMFAWSMYKQKQAEARAEQEAMTQAIQEDSGALGENAQKIIAKTIADGNLIDKAKSLGISQDTLAQAYAGNSAAIDEVNRKARENGMVTDKASGAAANYAAQNTHLSKTALDVTGSVAKMNGEVDKGKKAYDAQKVAAAVLGAQFDVNNQKLSAAEVAQLHMGDQTKNATQKVKDQNQAIQDLNQSLDAELSKQLQLQGGLTGIGQARLQMIDVLKKQKASTDLNTDSGLKQRSAIESVVGQLQSYRDSQIKAGESTAHATGVYESQAAQLLQTIAKTDGANSATYRYAKQLLKVPKDVSTKVGTTGVGVAASQLQGLGKQAKALGAMRVAIPTGTPNAKQTTQLLNDISDAALSANLKKVTIPTSSPTAIATKLKLAGIDGAAVSANKKSVTIPTKTLNSARTLREVEDILSTTKDKSMTVTAKASQFDHVLGLLGEAHRQAYNQSFTITAVYAKQNAGYANLARHGHADGTDDAAGGMSWLGERGPELVMSKSVGRLLAGSIVLNNQDTARTLSGDPGPIMRASGGSGATTYQTTHNSPIYIGQVVGADLDKVERQADERRVLESFRGRRS